MEDLIMEGMSVQKQNRLLFFLPVQLDIYDAMLYTPTYKEAPFRSMRFNSRARDLQMILYIILCTLAQQR